MWRRFSHLAIVGKGTEIMRCVNLCFLPHHPLLQRHPRLMQVYKIERIDPATGAAVRTYIGCGNAAAEYRAKKTQGNSKFLADVRKYAPYEQHFKLTVIVEQCASVAEMRNAEQYLIRNYNNGVGTLGKQGYNILKGHPPTDRKFRFLLANGLLKGQAKKQ